MNIASFLSLFLVVGLGSDVVFVYTDYWREALQYQQTEVEQLTYTLQRGGKASLATTVTTALSFFANLASVLRPLREFGFFMGLCVVFVWVMISLIYVPLCAVDAKYLQKCSLIRRRKRHKETSWQRSLGKLTGGVRQWRRTLVAVALLEFIVAGICIIVLAETDSGVPNIFPEDHNQNHGKEVMEKFPSIGEVMDSLFAPPKYVEDICHEYEFNANDQTNCSLFWCEVQTEADTPKSNPGDCKCYKKNKASCGGGTGSVELRAIGTDNLTTDAVETHIVQVLSQVSPGVSIQSSTASQSMAPVTMEEWESGLTMLMPMEYAQAGLQTSALCGWDELCFCNTQICKLSSDWTLLQHRLLNNGTSSARLLQASTPVWTIAASRRATVTVVFGIDVKLEFPLLGENEPADMWSFASSFDMSQPWSQRNMYDICTTAPTDLRITSQSCWITDFRQYLVARSQRFPTQRNNFDTLVTQFFVNGLTNLRSSSDFVWLRGDIVKASYSDFYVDVDKYEDSDRAIDYMKKWDQFLNNWNDEAARSTRGAWHTSALWVRAEAQEELVSSTALTLVIVISLAYVGMLAFTFDVVLSCYVVLSTLLVLIGLTFFIVVIVSWEIGPVEVIALIVFIGYAVTYSLHIAHKYSSNDALQTPPRLDLDEASATRFQRTEFALKSIGSAALGSAATTIGCSVFLLFCTLQIFQKLGGVVLMVTLLSILAAFLHLPALLLMAGPLRPGQYYWLLTSARDWQGTFERWRGRGQPASPKGLALESSPSQRMVPEEEKRAPPSTMQLPAKQMHVRVLHTAQVPKPRGMRPSVEIVPPLSLEYTGNAITKAINGDVVHKGVVVGINGNSISGHDVQLKGFDVGEESRREPLQAHGDGKYSNANVHQNDRWRGISPTRGNQPDFSNKAPPQPGYSAQYGQVGSVTYARGPSPDTQRAAPKSNVTYSMPRRDRFTTQNNGNTANVQRGNMPVGSPGLAQNGYGPPNNSPWPRPQGQSVGRSAGREPSPFNGMRLPSAQL